MSTPSLAKLLQQSAKTLESYSKKSKWNPQDIERLISLSEDMTENLKDLKVCQVCATVVTEMVKLEMNGSSMELCDACGIAALKNKMLPKKSSKSAVSGLSKSKKVIKQEAAPEKVQKTVAKAKKPKKTKEKTKPAKKATKAVKKKVEKKVIAVSPARRKKKVIEVEVAPIAQESLDLKDTLTAEPKNFSSDVDLKGKTTLSGKPIPQQPLANLNQMDLVEEVQKTEKNIYKPEDDDESVEDGALEIGMASVEKKQDAESDTGEKGTEDIMQEVAEGFNLPIKAVRKIHDIASGISSPMSLDGIYNFTRMGLASTNVFVAEEDLKLILKNLAGSGEIKIK